MSEPNGQYIVSPQILSLLFLWLQTLKDVSFSKMQQCAYLSTRLIGHSFEHTLSTFPPSNNQPSTATAFFTRLHLLMHNHSGNHKGGPWGMFPPHTSLEHLLSAKPEGPLNAVWQAHVHVSLHKSNHCTVLCGAGRYGHKKHSHWKTLKEVKHTQINL